MYDNKRKSKIKNTKILNWRMELANFQYDVKYRPGRYNEAAGAFTRVKRKNSATINSLVRSDRLYVLHKELGCPGVTRLFHQVKIRNLPYSVKDVESVCKSCEACCVLKPKFFKPTPGTLIKATQPFERLSIDFKGPLPKSKYSENRFILTIIDEFSRFPWAIPCKDASTNTAMGC